LQGEIKTRRVIILKIKHKKKKKEKKDYSNWLQGSKKTGRNWKRSYFQYKSR